jgi:diadenosine tetraphosphate (Ap4A) HIT family hydrolase
MPRIESFDGEKSNIGCLGCAIEKGKVEFSRATILLTKHFRINHDYQSPISGFVILSTRRHIFSVADFSEDEKKEFSELLIKIRKGMKKVLKIKDICIFQHENSKHHFHIWIFPVYEWTKKFGVESDIILPSLRYARKNMKTKANIKKVNDSVRKMREYMTKV